MNSAKTFTKALRTFLDKRNPPLSTAAYEIALNFPTQELKDFLLLFEMVFNYYNSIPSDYKDEEVDELERITQAMLDAAYEARKSG